MGFKPNILKILNRYILLNGHFKVFGNEPGKKSRFEGNMLTLMKRGADGKLRMYRQMAHD